MHNCEAQWTRNAYSNGQYQFNFDNNGQLTYTNAYPVGYSSVINDCNSYYYGRKKRDIESSSLHLVALAILRFRKVNTDHDGLIGYTEFSIKQ